MAITKRNLLCMKNKDKLDLGHKLLYEPYKNIISNFVNLSTNPSAIAFDPVSKAFDGLKSISKELKHYYEALLGVTSYYQHSVGGRGKYLEKRISSIVETCSLSIKISGLPLWLQYPKLHRKKGIFTLSGLTREEKSKIKKLEWNFLRRGDATTDLGGLLKEDFTIVLVELKNRVDSGGTSSRREIWTKKFKSILNILSKKDKIFEKDGKKFSLIELLEYFKIKKLEIYIGILFNVDGTPATKKGDKQKGFYSSNKEGYEDLKDAILSRGIKVIEEKPSKLEITLDIDKFIVKFGALYGNQVPYKLFKKRYSVSDLLVLKYDDIWLSQLTAINERTSLLKYNKNYITIFSKLLKKDGSLKVLYDDLIDSEGKKKYLKKIVSYLLRKYKKLFTKELKPVNKKTDEYLADIVQMLAAHHA